MIDDCLSDIMYHHCESVFRQVSRARRFLGTESVVGRCGSDPQPDSLSNCVKCGRGSDHATIFCLFQWVCFVLERKGEGEFRLRLATLTDTVII